MAGIDFSLIAYLSLWYLGNYYYNIYNKNVGRATGGAEFAFTSAVFQLVIGSVYAVFLWVAPDARPAPKMTFAQVMQLAPLGLWAAIAHGGAVYAMTAGAVSFGQIVKAGEPVFAAMIGYMFYNSKVSTAKIICLIPVIGGIAIASAKELDFTVASLLAASAANVASAFRGGENKRVMAGDMKSAINGTGNSCMRRGAPTATPPPAAQSPTST
jgi:solute carrier family 35 protein E1